MQAVFSQKVVNRLYELNKIGQFPELDHKGFSVLWFNPEFSERSKRVVNNQLHSHTFYEIHLILEGTCVYETADGAALAAQQYAYICIPPCTHHRLVSKSEDCRKISFAFAYTQNGDEAFVFPSEMIAVENCSWMESVFCSLALGLERGNGTELQIFQNVLSLLISFVADRRVATEQVHTQAATDKRFLRAKSFIEDNAVRDISVEEVAAFAYLSAKQLGRLFLENCGVTVAAFIAKVRCDKAKTLLEDNAHSVAEIVDVLGFSNEQNFNRFFKRMMGMTPGAYRKLKGREMI